MAKADPEDLRRLIINVNAAILLSRVDDPGQKDINRAVQTARELDKAVRLRLRWEQRRVKNGHPPEGP